MQWRPLGTLAGLVIHVGSLAPPLWLHTHHPVLMVALDVTLLRRGCVQIDGGVQVRYRAGDTTFTRSMDGDDSAGTTLFC